MKAKILITLLILFFCTFLQAQTEWEANRQLFELSEEEKELPLYILYRSIQYDYKYDESSDFVCDITFHEIVRVNNDNALSERNRIYISMYNTIDLLELQARAIAPDGRIISLDKSNIKEIEDENSTGYKIFAVEGAEVGGEIEYRYVKRINGNVFESERAQFTSPLRKMEFALKCPEFMEWTFRTVNDTTSVTQVDESEDFNLYEAEITNVPAYVNEDFSAGDNNIKRIDFKLTFNTNMGPRRLNTYATAGQNVYRRLTNLTKGEQKKISDFIKKNDIKSTDPIERLKHLEHEVKQRFNYEEYNSGDVEDLFKNGFAGKQAFNKLFKGIFDYLQIPHELVVTGDRGEKPFYAGFEDWSYLTDYLFYLPGEDAFLSPYYPLIRYGMVPSNLSAMKGLFVKEEQITDFTFPVTRIAYIPESRYNENMNNLDIQVSFDDDLVKAKVKAKMTYLGQEASIYKYTLTKVNEERKKEVLENLVEYLATDAEIEQVEVVKGASDYKKWSEPFVIRAGFTSENFLEQAGNSLLFKIGELIGAQSEMYQDDERKYEIENAFNRGYERRIVVNIPKGYEVRNADDIRIREEVKEGDRTIFKFQSDYELKGNQLIVTIDEFYDEIYYPAGKIEAFRKVINAAADFNKVTLILKEK